MGLSLVTCRRSDGLASIARILDPDLSGSVGGKQQIVIGLLTAEDGEPLAVRVFEGNTADPTTVASQITILKEQFGIAEVVMVGDRGM